MVTSAYSKIMFLGRLASNLIHKFRFDGIKYDRCIDTSSGALPLSLDLQSEVPKMQLIWQLIDGDRSEIPKGAFINHVVSWAVQSVTIKWLKIAKNAKMWLCVAKMQPTCSQNIAKNVAKM